MIRIYRTSTAPAKLSQKGSHQTALDCAAYDAAPADYIAHRESFRTKSYYKRDVKDVLMRIHHQKCCYCETKLPIPANLHVEHFRPKGAVRQSRDDNDEFPGYYWLAYSWENLLLACFDCNTTYKGTVFPLENPTQRACSHHDDLAVERELFVNPAEEDPREHIRFHGDLPVWCSERGRHTIEGLGLRSTILRDQRQLRLEEINQLINLVRIVEANPHPDKRDQEDVRKARSLIAEATQPNAEFSAMVMDLVAQREF